MFYPTDIGDDGVRGGKKYPAVTNLMLVLLHAMKKDHGVRIIAGNRCAWFLSCMFLSGTYVPITHSRCYLYI